MNWLEYKAQVFQKARKMRKNDAYIKRYLVYAKNLFFKNLPIIFKAKQISDMAGLDHNYVCSMSRCPHKFYRTFTIPKSNGNKRIINEPLPDLKSIQKWILTEILQKIPVSPFAKAYLKKHSVKDNARFHRRQKTLVCLDIKDFFPSIHISLVIDTFLQMGYSRNISAFLANLCCLDASLPQGAPTSPYLSNLIMRPVDNQISDYCLTNKLRFTRYADDITISGDMEIRTCIRIINDILYQNGFRLNPIKTRVIGQNGRQEVTGIVVNKYMQIPRKERMDIRQSMYYIMKFGLDSHVEYLGENRKHYAKHLLGKINFALFINPYDAEMQKYYANLKAITLNLEV